MACNTVPAQPYQPKTIKFPKRTFGKTNPVQRSFQASWFDSYSWLHYDEVRDIAFCHICMVAKRDGKLKTQTLEKAFILTGFSNWKDASRSFKLHEKSDCHREAVEKIVILPKITQDVGEMLSKAHAVEKEDNRECLLTILSSVRFLARQGLALRGDGDECDSNYMQLLTLRGEEDSKILEWLKRKNEKYTCADSQNEMLQVMALSILREVAKDIQNSEYYSVMADETTDGSNREQLVLVIRHVSEDLVPHEEFIGLHKVPSIDADTLTKTISDQEPRAIFTHCYGHALNLAVADTVRQSKVMRDALDTTYEISKLLKFSPKRDSLFERIKQELAPETPGFRTLCPTRWTVRAASLQSVVDNYTVLQDLWDECDPQDSEIRARVLGVSSQMRSFNYLFGVMLANAVLSLTDNLSQTLQGKSLSASEGQRLAKLTLRSLEQMRSEEEFSTFWKKVNNACTSLDVSEPTLPRKRKVPKRYELGSSEGSHPTSVEEVYRPLYFEAIDLTMAAIRDRFDQPGYRVLCDVEKLLINGSHPDTTDYTSELNDVCAFYGDDLDKDRLNVQLSLLRTHFKSVDKSAVELSDVITFLQQQSVTTLVRILLVIPATNATSERTFSALRRIKTYLRTTMSQARLNHLMVLHIHKEKTDILDLKQVATEFCASRERRQCVFGAFQ